MKEAFLSVSKSPNDISGDPIEFQMTPNGVTTPRLINPAVNKTVIQNSKGGVDHLSFQSSPETFTAAKVSFF